MRRLSSLWPAAVLLLAAACGGNGQLGSRFVKSVPVTASQGATITVNSVDEPELAGTSLYIPPGALAFDTTITVEVGDSDIVNGASSAGPVAIFGPSGLIFHQPAKLTLPYEVAAGREGDLFVQVLEDDGLRFNVEHSALEIDTSQKLLRFDINGFTAFQPGTTVSDGGQWTCSANSQCAAGQVCVNGACQSPANDAGCNSAGVCGFVCTNSAQCLPGESCVSGRCQASNTFDAGCAPGQCGAVDAGSCSNGACNTSDAGSGLTCSSTSQCASGQVCLQGRCTASNTSDGGSCAPGTTCFLDGGSGGGGCNSAGVCDGGSGFSDAGSGFSDAGSGGGGCSSGTTCADAGAVRTCNSSLDCGAFGQCVNGVCI